MTVPYRTRHGCHWVSRLSGREGDREVPLTRLVPGRAARLVRQDNRLRRGTPGVRSSAVGEKDQYLTIFELLGQSAGAVRMLC